MAKYRRPIIPEELEEQQEEERLAKQREEEEIKAREKKEDEQLSHEELTFKKRYGDLRAYSQRVEQELRSQIDELRKQLENAAKAQMEMRDVASPDDAKAWAAKYPELAKIFRYFAMEESKEASTKVEKSQAELENLKRDIQRRQAYARLLELQPDFEKIATSQEFQEWIASKGENHWTFQAIYHNDTDPVIASDVITLFKATRKKPERDDSTKNSRKEAAQTVTKKTSSNVPLNEDGEIIWSESYIEEMSKKDRYFFDKHEDEIMSAIRSGKFLYDLTNKGAAQ